MSRFVICTLLAFCLTFVSSATTSAVAQEKTVQPPQQTQPEDIGTILVKGLKAVDGCIDVKTCEWSDGKQSIVAWFENKEAAASWYYSETHQGMMRAMTDGGFDDEAEPMEHIKDEEQPIMVIASLTPSAKMDLPGVKMPISQISIELFAPLPGGAQVGGRVSPPEFKVPYMDNYTPPKESATDKDQRFNLKKQ